MANLFKSPLVLLENVVGTLLDQRSVILYKQEEYYGLQVATALGNKSVLGDDYLNVLIKANANELLGYLVQKNLLEELFVGIEVPYLSGLNGFNMYGISYMDADIGISSDIAEHPIEDGSVITDTSIRNPITAKVQISMPTSLYTKIYQQIYDYYTKKQKIMLKTKFGMIKNLVISEMPYNINADNVDRVPIMLSLREIIEVSPETEQRDFSNGLVANPSDSNTVDSGRRIAQDFASAILGG